MRKILISALLLGILSYPAYADRVDAVVDATTDLVTVVTLTKGAHKTEHKYEGDVNIDGTFNGCTIHWLKSTDGGTNKSVVRDLSGVAVTSSSEDSFPVEWGWPNGSASFILYASADTCTGTPNLIIDLDDNLR